MGSCNYLFKNSVKRFNYIIKRNGSALGIYGNSMKPIKNCIDCIYNKNNFCVKFEGTVEKSRNMEVLCGVDGKYFEEHYKITKEEVNDINEKISHNELRLALIKNIGISVFIFYFGKMMMIYFY
jgi:hypothetical protein